jgi:hypothetical protein
MDCLTEQRASSYHKELVSFGMMNENEFFSTVKNAELVCNFLLLLI